MLTELDARARWCPFHRKIVPGHLRVRSDEPPTVNPSMVCIGSLCMAWRWGPTADPPTGYCGLAGQDPEPAPAQRQEMPPYTS